MISVNVVKTIDSLEQTLDALHTVDDAIANFNKVLDEASIESAAFIDRNSGSIAGNHLELLTLQEVGYKAGDSGENFTNVERTTLVGGQGGGRGSRSRNCTGEELKFLSAETLQSVIRNSGAGISDNLLE